MHEKIRHIDLFSGIGGFSLAADRVFGDVEHIFVEWDEFCTEVLKKHWPEAEYHKDIHQFITDTRHKRQEEQKQQTMGSEELCRTTLITGGFPCQPFSQAGRRKGTADDRYLWPAMLEAITLFKPKWVIAENVAGLVTWNDGMVLETVCSDLEREGYEVQPFVIPACAVQAPHRRDRVWIIGYSNSLGLESGINRECKVRTTRRGIPAGWEKNWPEVAAELCRVDDGIPKRLDRNPRLKALGNAIVPQVAEEIFKAIKLTLCP